MQTFQPDRTHSDCSRLTLFSTLKFVGYKDSHVAEAGSATLAEHESAQSVVASSVKRAQVWLRADADKA